MPSPSSSAPLRAASASPRAASPVISIATGAPRPTNPNPFAVQSTPGTPPSSSRLKPEVSPTDGSPLDDFPILNFGRRPSAVDPLAPSFNSTSSTSYGGPTSRQLVSGGLSSPTRASSQASAAAAAQAAARPVPPPLPLHPSHARRQSHSRNPSISLPPPSPGASPLPSPTGMGPAQPSGKILPLQPVPTRTRAPMEAFASVEMLQGQREHQDRMRGSEVFGRDGKYEGRASLSGASGEGAHVSCALVSLPRRPRADLSSTPNSTTSADKIPRRAFELLVDPTGWPEELLLSLLSRWMSPVSPLSSESTMLEGGTRRFAGSRS